ncbi:NADP-dependent oxidoreductase [Microbacteriaceae bacterium K1510]|nr:NADP-dependent oxidoreductase [Microbacteriaceae bacterium K1510]
MPTEIPDYRLPPENRQVLLARRPSGIPQDADFGIASVPIAKPGPGNALVRNIYLSVDPAQRGWAAAEANYSTPVAIGSPMRALAVGVVIESETASLQAGDFLYGWFGWQDYAVIEPSQVVLRATHELPLTAFACLLGINGVTAYLALTELGKPRRGETLLVSTAAGSVGSFVGQIGRQFGCRTVGLTGQDTKAALCKERYGYDVAINYKSAGLSEALATAAPDGLNVYFDNTGGAILDTALRHMAVQGRIVQCGTAATESWSPPPTGLRNEREVLTRRLTWRGFVIFDHMAAYEAAADELARLYRSGSLVYDVDIDIGIEHAPGAIAALYAGENRGKKLIYIG